MLELELELENEKTSETETLRKVKAAEERLAQATAEVDRLRRRVAHAVEDRYDDARRAVRRGRYAAEDLLDETSHRIKRDPFASVATTFGVGLAAGIIIGWLLKRDR